MLTLAFALEVGHEEFGDERNTPSYKRTDGAGMTTIAYKDGVIAYDSRMTQGDLICTDNCDKHRCVDGVHYFFAGPVPDQDELIACYMDRTRVPQGRPSVSAFIVDGDKVLEVGLTEETGFWACDAYDNSAMGSGRDFALAAMDLGC